MLPRADSDLYVCRTVKFINPGACPMARVKRAAVEAAVLGILERVGLDYEATEAHVANGIDSRLETITEQARRATLEAAEKVSQRERIERDYVAGTLPADLYAPWPASSTTSAKAPSASVIVSMPTLSMSRGSATTSTPRTRRSSGSQGCAWRSPPTSVPPMPRATSRRCGWPWRGSSTTSS